MKSLIKKGTTAIIGLLLFSTPAYSEYSNNNQSSKSDSKYSTNVTQNLIGKSILETTNESLSLKQNLKRKNILVQANPKNSPNTLTNTTTLKLNNNQSSLFTAANAAKILPADTALFGYVNTSSPDWEDMGRFQLFRLLGQVISTSLIFLPSEYTNYASYLQPWIGDHVVFAFLPKSENKVSSIDSSFLTLAAVKDEQALQGILDKFKRSVTNIKEQEYKGIQILEIDTSQGSSSLTQRSTLNFLQLRSSKTPLKRKPKINSQKQTLAIAIVPGYATVATSVQPIKQLIDSFVSQGNTDNLFDNPNFQPGMSHPLANKAMFGMYQNPMEYVNLLESFIKDPRLSVPPESMELLNTNIGQIKEQIKSYNSTNSFITIQPEGLRFQVVAHRKKPLTASQVELANIPEEKILSSIPAATYSAFTGKNINQTWQIISRLFATQPKAADSLEEFRKFFRSNTGLDFEKDIINWMDGEYAFFFYPTKGGFLSSVNPNLSSTSSNLNLGIGLSFQTSNRQAVSNTLDKLDEFIQTVSKNEVTVSNSTIKGNSVTSWESQSPTDSSNYSVLAYSWLDDDTVMITTGKGAIADLVPQPYLSLPSAYNFKTATNSFPHPNQGYFYMNMGSVLSWVYGFVPTEFNSPYFQMFKQGIGSIYSISSSSSTTAEQEQFDTLIVLAPVRKELNRFEKLKN